MSCFRHPWLKCRVHTSHTDIGKERGRVIHFWEVAELLLLLLCPQQQTLWGVEEATNAATEHVVHITCLCVELIRKINPTLSSSSCLLVFLLSLPLISPSLSISPLSSLSPRPSLSSPSLFLSSLPIHEQSANTHIETSQSLSAKCTERGGWLKSAVTTPGLSNVIHSFLNTCFVYAQVKYV